MAADSRGARSCDGTFFICCVAVALIAADGKDGTPRIAAIPSAMITAGWFVRCNDGVELGEAPLPEQDYLPLRAA